MIKAQGLTKHYGDVIAIENLNFEVEQGEIVGFLGPNGAGKTTVMRILTGYMPATEGEAEIAGYDTFSDSLEARRHIGYLPETVPLYSEMTVRGYLHFLAEIRGVRDRKAAADEAMERCGVEDRANNIINTLSKGYRQRVGLAQALVHKPDVLILDEPTIGLDPRQIIGVRELIRELGQKQTILLSSHILPEVSEVCTRVLIIHNGHIVAEDAPDKLTDRLQETSQLIVQVSQPSPEAEKALAAIPGVLQVQPIEEDKYKVISDSKSDIRTRVAETVTQGGWGLLGLQIIKMSLEDIFLQVTQEDPAIQEPPSEVEPNA